MQARVGFEPAVLRPAPLHGRNLYDDTRECFFQVGCRVIYVTCIHGSCSLLPEKPLPLCTQFTNRQTVVNRKSENILSLNGIQCYDFCNRGFCTTAMLHGRNNRFFFLWEKMFFSYAKHFHCFCHATWLPCKTSIPEDGSARQVSKTCNPGIFESKISGLKTDLFMCDFMF